LLPELVRREPCVEIRRRFVLLIVQQLGQGRFLVGAALQQHDRAGDLRRIVERALIVSRLRDWMNVSLELHEPCFIDSFRDARGNGRSLANANRLGGGLRRDTTRGNKAKCGEQRRENEGLPEIRFHNPPKFGVEWSRLIRRARKLPTDEKGMQGADLFAERFIVGRGHGPKRFSSKPVKGYHSRY